jgi:phage gp45-like
MKRISLLMILIIFFFVAGNVMAQSGKVGINTSLPVTGLHVQDSGVLFNHGFYLFENFPSIDNALPPISGAGARFMWFPHRKAFRVGQVDGTQWDRNSTGNLSFATGVNNTAHGRISSVFGRNNTANGDVCFVIGEFNAPVVSAGFNTANAPALMSTAPLFIIGNGDAVNGNSNAMLIRKDGNVGIGTNAPTDKLHIIANNTEDALRVQVNNSTKLRVWNNGGTSLGIGSSPPLNGLLVSGSIQPQNGISTTAKLRVESTGDSIVLKAGSSEIMIADNGNIVIRTAAGSKIEMNANGNIQMSGASITINASATLNLNGALVRFNNGSTPVAKQGSVSAVSGSTATVTSNVSNTVLTQ